MSPFGNRRSLLNFALCLSPASVLASPLAARDNFPEDIIRRGNDYKIPCGNAPSIMIGDPVTAADIVIPSQDDGPPQATSDPSGYFPYVWCGAGTSTYVFIDPLGSYGFNKGTNEPIFWTALQGAYNLTQNAVATSGDRDIDIGHSTSLTWNIFVTSVAGKSGIQWVQVFAQDSNHQHLTYGIYGAALSIMQNFILSYPLYADTSYFQIGDGKWGTVANGYVGIGLTTNGTYCYLKGNPAQNTGVICRMPSNYPDN